MTIKSWKSQAGNAVCVEMWSNGDLYVKLEEVDTGHNRKAYDMIGGRIEAVYDLDGYLPTGQENVLIGLAFKYIKNRPVEFKLGQAVSTTHRCEAEHLRGETNFAFFGPGKVGIITRVGQTVPIWKGGPVHTYYQIDFVREHIDGPDEICRVICLGSELVETEDIPAWDLREHAKAMLS